MLRFFAARKLGALALVLATGIVASGCNWTWLWSGSYTIYSGAPGMGLGNNDQAYVTVGPFPSVDVSIDPPESSTIDQVEANCINAGQQFNNCAFNVIAPYVSSGGFSNIEKEAIADANCGIPGCTYGVSMYWAAIGYTWGNAGQGCMGFRVSGDFFNGIYYVTNSWYYMKTSLAGGSGDPPGGAFCPT